jgi:hypothetical protein
MTGQGRNDDHETQLHHGRCERRGCGRGHQGSAQSWTPAARYPDPAIEILDPSFAKYRVANAALERIGTAIAGAKDRCGSATRACCYGATSRTT